ncbi:Golgi SNAP receptor complex member 1 [Euwallacea fornicatus]|uniref:Golgi SNAP receptor complex member 1 n=1 Tax=Euwallacea fornicatus TaxID=995702 RepID=UPI00338DF3BB
MATALSYTDLRKQARQLENEIDLKLVAFSKLEAGIKTPHAGSHSDTVPLLSGEDTFEVMSVEIEDLLNKLTLVNERLSEQPVSGAAMLHTIQRHREILADLARDFRKTNSQHETRREREDLLRGDGTFRADGINNRRDMYLKETQHIHNSDHLVNEQIAIAVETREHLTSQRQTLKRLQTRFNDISNKYPIINSVINRINLRKRRDSVIIGLVVAFCTLLMLLYMFG